MASRGVNKVILVGNLGQDPEVRYMPNGGAVANITLATSESWRDKATGEMKEQTEWHRVVLFGKLAEVASEYLRKGSQVYIEGQLRTRKWTDQSGSGLVTPQKLWLTLAALCRCWVVVRAALLQVAISVVVSRRAVGVSLSSRRVAISSAAARSLVRSSPLRQRRLTSRRWTLMMTFRSTFSVIKTIGYIVLRWMIKASASHKKEASVMEASTYQVKIIGHCGGVEFHLFYHHRLDVVPDSGDIRHCDAKQPHREPAGGNHAQTAADHCKPDIIRPTKTDVECAGQKHHYGMEKLPAKRRTTPVVRVAIKQFL